jgi:hypothetical protein
MKPTGKRPALKTTTVGGRVLVYYDSVLQAIGIDPASEPADRPKTVTIKRTHFPFAFGFSFTRLSDIRSM